MKPVQLLSSLTIAAALASSAAGQVPPDHGVYFGSNAAPPVVVDPASGAMTVISGIFGSPTSTTAGFLDPVTGELWVGGCGGFAAGKIYRISMSGLAASGSSLVGGTGGGDVVGMDHDWNGDVYVCDAQTIYKIDRATGTIALWDTNSYGAGDLNALCIDQSTNRMWVGTWDDGTIGSSLVVEFDLTVGPGSATVVVDVQAQGFDGRITGMDDVFGTIHVCTEEDALGQSVLIVDPLSGVAFPAPGAPLRKLAGIAFDHRNFVAHLIEGDGSCVVFSGVIEDYHILNISGPVLTTFAGLPDPPSQSYHDVAVNDFLDLTEVFPRRPSATAAFTLEAAAHGLPGNIAGTAVTAINGAPLPAPILLGAGLCDAGGFQTSNVPVPAGTLSAGDSIDVTGLRLIGGGAGFVFTPPVNVIFGP